MDSAISGMENSLESRKHGLDERLAEYDLFNLPIGHNYCFTHLDNERH